MKKVRLLSTNLKSGSLKRLAEGLSKKLGYKVWRSSVQKPNRIHYLYGDCKNKLYQYQWFEANGVPSVPFTTDAEVAKEWLKKHTVLGRQLLQSSEGKGIVVCEPKSELKNAKVWTQYIPKKREYRIHIFDDKVVQVLEKRRKKGVYNGESKIRNTANGYVFCSQDVWEPEGLRDLALKASKVTTSHFKGVDIGFNEKKNQMFVIEVNSAPGIEGSNVDKYVEVITNAA